MLSKKQRIKNKSQIFGSYEVVYLDKKEDIEKSRFIMADSETSAVEQFKLLMSESRVDFVLVEVICPS
jgi:hypothetical protein